MYNDYLLLDLIKERNDDALSILFEKYTPLIYREIRKHKIFDEFLTQDYLALGYDTLSKSIYTYDDSYGKTFTRYFELLLIRDYKRAQMKRHSQEIVLDFDINKIEDTSFEYNIGYIEIDEIDLSNREEYIFIQRFRENNSVSKIAKDLSITVKQVYNTIQRIKDKLDKSDIY